DSFLRIQNSPTESGYNTGSPRGTFPPGFPDFDQLKGNFTYNIQLGTIPKTSDGMFRRFLLDLNEPNGGGKETISLAKFQVFVGANANVFINGDTSKLVDGGPFGKLVYDLNNPPGAMTPDNHIIMTDMFSGSGTTDVAIDIPEVKFTGQNATQYVTLFAQFSNSEGGFEEFVVQGVVGGAGPGGSGGEEDARTRRGA